MNKVFNICNKLFNPLIKKYVNRYSTKIEVNKRC